MADFAKAKSYVAIVTVRREELDVTLALEFEKTPKSNEHYADVLDKFDAERKLDRFLYLA